jgi:hypothetical protein
MIEKSGDVVWRFENGDTLVYLGEIGIDTGTCLIGDPLYTRSIPEDPAQEWEDPRNRIDVGGPESSIAKRFPIHPDLCQSVMTVWTGMGDGSYPVHARVSPDGRVVSVTVQFLAEDNELPAPAMRRYIGFYDPEDGGRNVEESSTLSLGPDGRLTAEKNGEDEPFSA